MEVLALKRQFETVYTQKSVDRMCPHAGLLCESEPLSCSHKTSEWDPKKFGNIGEVEGVRSLATSLAAIAPGLSLSIHISPAY
jgi:hypothetical protein